MHKGSHQLPELLCEKLALASGARVQASKLDPWYDVPVEQKDLLHFFLEYLLIIFGFRKHNNHNPETTVKE